MTRLSTHILDTSLGRPAAEVRVMLAYRTASEWHIVTEGVTDRDGRVQLGEAVTQDGAYRLHFLLGDYFARDGRDTLYPRVTLEVTLSAAQPHYHLPLLIAPYAYSTYRGS